MANTEVKTKRTANSVDDFLNTITDDNKRKDCLVLLKLMQTVSKSKPKMWGTSIVGFGEFHYKSKSGREGDWFKIGFSPRKQNLTLYVMTDFTKHKSHFEKLGKVKTGKSCIYINSLKDIDEKVFKALIETALKNFNEDAFNF